MNISSKCKGNERMETGAGEMVKWHHSFWQASWVIKKNPKKVHGCDRARESQEGSEACGPFGVLPLYPRSYFNNPSYLPSFPCLQRSFSFTFCPFNYTTTTSRSAIFWPTVLFFLLAIYLPLFGNGSHQHAFAWCVYADNTPVSTETDCF